MAVMASGIHDFKEVNSNPSKETFQDTATAWTAPQSELSTERECAISFHAPMKIVFPTKEANSEERKKLSQHGPEYDFTMEEILPSVHDLQGWHPRISEKEISQTLTKHLRTDGHFILFYWNRKRRPAISVSFTGSIMTYIIHKKPAKRTGSDTLFFIDHNGPYDTNLKNLINYHIQNGIVHASSQNIISLSYPVTSF